MSKRKTNEQAATEAVAQYQSDLIVRLKKRRRDIRMGSVQPIDQNGTVIRKDNTVSINATVGANGELTRLLCQLEGREIGE